MTDTAQTAIETAVARRAAGLKFPKLFALVLLLFLIDLIVPDFIPMVDEIILGLLALILGTIRNRRRGG